MAEEWLGNEMLNEYSEINELETQLEESKNKYLYLLAEFENYKKRTTKQNEEFKKTANEKLLIEMLSILDDFDRAIDVLGKGFDSGMVKGVSIILNKFKNLLKNNGVSELECNVGDIFNSDIHEAVTYSDYGAELRGKVVQVAQKGYTLFDKIIRFPKVCVGR